MRSNFSASSAADRKNWWLMLKTHNELSSATFITHQWGHSRQVTTFSLSLTPEPDPWPRAWPSGWAWPLTLTWMTSGDIQSVQRWKPKCVLASEGSAEIQAPAELRQNRSRSPSQGDRTVPAGVGAKTTRTGQSCKPNQTWWPSRKEKRSKLLLSPITGTIYTQDHFSILHHWICTFGRIKTQSCWARNAAFSPRFSFGWVLVASVWNNFVWSFDTSNHLLGPGKDTFPLFRSSVWNFHRVPGDSILFSVKLGLSMVEEISTFLWTLQGRFRRKRC